MGQLDRCLHDQPGDPGAARRCGQRALVFVIAALRWEDAGGIEGHHLGDFANIRQGVENSLKVLVFSSLLEQDRHDNNLSVFRVVDEMRVHWKGLAVYFLFAWGMEVKLPEFEVLIVKAQQAAGGDIDLNCMPVVGDFSGLRRVLKRQTREFRTFCVMGFNVDR